MSDLVIRPLVAGEENLFESMPDPLPQLRQVGYADGIARRSPIYTKMFL